MELAIKLAFLGVCMLVLIGSTTHTPPQPRKEAEELQTFKPLITASSEVRITRESVPYVEPYILADPKDSRHLVAAGIMAVQTAGGNSISCAAFASFDGGQTWRGGTRTAVGPIRLFGRSLARHDP
jgi:hypothetical protein